MYIPNVPNRCSWSVALTSTTVQRSKCVPPPRGVRVAWSCVGAVLSLGGAGWARAALLAVPRAPPAPAAPAAPRCATEEASTDSSGAFRYRPNVYPAPAYFSPDAFYYVIIS